MKIGLCAWSFTGAHREAKSKIDPHIPEHLAGIAVASGLSSIETAAEWLAQRKPEERAEFRDLLTDYNLDLILDTGSEQLPEDPTPLLTAINTATEFGAHVVRTTISSVLEGDRRRYGASGWHTHLASLVDPLRKIMNTAESSEVSVGIENHQDICSQELVWLCEQVDSPRLGVTMDCANALAVGETPEHFAKIVLPYLKHVHLKDYQIYPTPSGFQFCRCSLGTGVVNWPKLLRIFEDAPGDPGGCIELGASTARHIRILEPDYWETFELGNPFPERCFNTSLDAIQQLHNAALAKSEEWRTPHERGESPKTCSSYELQQFEASVIYLKEIGALPITK